MRGGQHAQGLGTTHGDSFAQTEQRAEGRLRARLIPVRNLGCNRTYTGSPRGSVEPRLEIGSQSQERRTQTAHLTRLVSKSPLLN